MGWYTAAFERTKNIKPSYHIAPYRTEVPLPCCFYLRRLWLMKRFDSSIKLWYFVFDTYVNIIHHLKQTVCYLGVSMSEPIPMHFTNLKFINKISLTVQMYHLWNFPAICIHLPLREVLGPKQERLTRK